MRLLIIEHEQRLTSSSIIQCLPMAMAPNKNCWSASMTTIGNIVPASPKHNIKSGRRFGTEKNPVFDSIRHRGYRLQKDRH